MQSGGSQKIDFLDTRTHEKPLMFSGKKEKRKLKTKYKIEYICENRFSPTTALGYTCFLHANFEYFFVRDTFFLQFTKCFWLCYLAPHRCFHHRIYIISLFLQLDTVFDIIVFLLLADIIVYNHNSGFTYKYNMTRKKKAINTDNGYF